MSTVANALMLIGGLVWLAGELIGVARTDKGDNDTTTEHVRRLRRRFPRTVTIAVSSGLIVLGSHFLIDWP